MQTGQLDPLARPALHPAIYMVLMLPFGATGGFVSVALTFLATRSQLTVAQGATLVAASMFPNIWKFFWAPISDTTLTRKKWYLLSNVLCAIGMVSMAVVPLGPDTLHLMRLLILLTSFAATFLAFSVEAMVAHLTPHSQHGRVSGWLQAGNLGGSGIVGGWVGLQLLERFPAHAWITGGLLGLLTLACCAPLALLPDVPAEPSRGSPIVAVRNVAVDMWGLIRSREGMLCALLCFVPIGTGAATSVLTQAEVAALWGASDHHVSLTQGIANGVLSAVGCLVAGPICDRLGARNAYATFGALMAAVGVGMALAPMVPATYVGFSLAYAFVTGLCFAAFSAFVLDVIGAGNAATKYNGFASLSNTPIMYMGLVIAAAYGRWGTSAMLYTEAAFAVLGIAVFAVASYFLRPMPVPPPVEPSPA